MILIILTQYFNFSNAQLQLEGMLEDNLIIVGDTNNIF